jgi:hypothetical protein
MAYVARLTHQSEHTSVLARNGILPMTTTIRFGRLMRRRRSAHNPL